MRTLVTANDASSPVNQLQVFLEVELNADLGGELNAVLCDVRMVPGAGVELPLNSISYMALA